MKNDEEKEDWPDTANNHFNLADNNLDIDNFSKNSKKKKEE